MTINVTDHIKHRAFYCSVLKQTNKHTHTETKRDNAFNEANSIFTNITI